MHPFTGLPAIFSKALKKNVIIEGNTVMNMNTYREKEGKRLFKKEK